MNKNQENFLNEFHDLLQKYSINEIYISYHSGDKRDYRITLGSNGQKLEFMGYLNNHFIEVGTYDGIYEASDSHDQPREILHAQQPLMAESGKRGVK